MKYKDASDKGRQERESSSFLYRTDLNSVSKVSIKNMSYMKNQLELSVWRDPIKIVLPVVN
jgi:hypothetical protein